MTEHFKDEQTYVGNQTNESPIANIIGSCVTLPIIHKTNGRWTQQRSMEKIDYGYSMDAPYDKED